MPTLSTLTAIGKLCRGDVLSEANQQVLRRAMGMRAHGLADYSDSATASSPITVLGDEVPVPLTNNNLGSNSYESLPYGVTRIWDTTSNSFVFDELSVDDEVELRVDVEVTTTAPNQLVILDLELGVGGFAYTVPFVLAQPKNAGPYRALRSAKVYIKDDNTRLNGGVFRVSSDGNATVIVNGWYCSLSAS